ncbi:MAG: hypothetical protein A3J28_10875 [Acidobacteria bacterium RIFCSPLOWO2_12_FULL_60_22]|nr:MAG: hypothetical protein A3J28_10875 [Acidobacteria bacterium RIFCSPLOWO2_12_FULL_60_22]
MTKRLFVAALVLAIGGLQFALAQSNGNPRPGFPHDTIIIHVQKASNGPKLCTGGHSLFLRYDATGRIPATTVIWITMTDWVQVDNDGDGLFDEDPVDGINNDGDFNPDGTPRIDEDPIEIGGITTAMDCDSWGDNRVDLQIRDADPRHGVVSTQEWFMRLVGKPEQTFSFISYANQKIVCTFVSAGADGIVGTSDDIASCTALVGTIADWIELARFNLANPADGSTPCVKQVKLGGKGVHAGGKTPFCNITDGFEVDVDQNGDGIIDLLDQFVFSISCLDDPATSWNEELFCPLSSVIWGSFETNEFSKAQAQIFVSHTGSASVKTGKIVR